MQNISKQNWYDPRVQSRESSVSGHGSFTNAPIKKGEVIIRWGGGVLVTDDEFQKGNKEGKYQPETAVHFDENHKWVGLASEPDINDAFLNHSCDPNLWFVDSWSLVARRDIKTGEELTFDYATGETYPLQSECKCGSKICRKFITGEGWKDPNFQKIYRGHFNPYIQGLINKYC